MKPHRNRNKRTRRSSQSLVVKRLSIWYYEHAYAWSSLAGPRLTFCRLKRLSSCMSSPSGWFRAIFQSPMRFEGHCST